MAVTIDEPGVTNICCASITRVRAAATLRTSPVDPTAMKRPFFTANASARERAASLVNTRALTTMRSASTPDLPRRAAAPQKQAVLMSELCGG
ncbi:MAG: hypothetical protein DMG02_13765 [Acidobacteria bacterium]|nr:MAG: hypothetical protein DMG02_13765 [Acidobacteriota bacterium]